MTIVGSWPTGWECPKCGQMYAPTVDACWICQRGIAVTTTTGNGPVQRGLTTHVRAVREWRELPWRFTRLRSGMQIRLGAFGGANEDAWATFELRERESAEDEEGTP